MIILSWWDAGTTASAADRLWQAECGEDAGRVAVVAQYCHRLDLAGIVDQSCPIRENVAILTHGQVIEALVANRLTPPSPLYRVQDWARAWAVGETLGVDPAALGDDRIASNHVRHGRFTALAQQPGVEFHLTINNPGCPLGARVCQTSGATRVEEN